VRCPHCGNKLVQRSGDRTRVRIHGGLEFSADGSAQAGCYWCKQPVQLPLRLLRPAEDGETFTLTEPSVAGARRRDVD
jgi:hypothetical protein